MNGGQLVANALRLHDVQFLFTLCGGHISPILVEAKRAGLRVVDVRHEPLGSVERRVVTLIGPVEEAKGKRIVTVHPCSLADEAASP